MPSSIKIGPISGPAPTVYDTLLSELIGKLRNAPDYLLPARPDVDPPLPFRDYIRESWHVLEEANPLVWGWHIDAMAEHLTAVVDGQIQKLIINIPPGMTKSRITSVMLPTWVWTFKPQKRFLTASHGRDLSIRDAVFSRDLINSEWYQDRYKSTFRLKYDQNAKSRYSNNRTGFRIAISTGSGTGERGDYRILDDPHNADDAQSDVMRESVIEWYRNTWSQRGTAQDSAEMLIMQRHHKKDLSGFLFEEIGGFERLMLPMEYDPKRHCVTVIGFTDPRTIPGDLLCPDRFNRDTVEKQKKTFGPYLTSGQYQQEPAPAEGGLFKKSDFPIVDTVPALKNVIRRWDLAATAESVISFDPDWTAGVKIGTGIEDGYTYVLDVRKVRGNPDEVEALIKETASVDGWEVPIHLPQDPGQAGKSQARYYVKQLARYTVNTSIESGSKITRAGPVASQARQGLVRLLRGHWNHEFLDELAIFPNGAHDDQVDALSGGYNDINEVVKKKGGNFAEVE